MWVVSLHGFESARHKHVTTPTKHLLTGADYLSCVGANGTLKTNKSKITKDELFQIADSEPQFVINDSKGKQVSIRSSVEVKADQADVTDRERFQLEVDASGSTKIALKANNGQYFTLGADGTVSASAKGKTASEYFAVEVGSLGWWAERSFSA